MPSASGGASMDSVADESWSTWNCRLPDLREAICPQDDPRLLWLQHDTVCHEGWYWLGVKFVVTTKTSDLFLSDIIGNVLNSCTCVIVEVNCLVKLVLVNIEKKIWLSYFPFQNFHRWYHYLFFLFACRLRSWVCWSAAAVSGVSPVTSAPTMAF